MVAFDTNARNAGLAAGAATIGVLFTRTSVLMEDSPITASVAAEDGVGAGVGDGSPPAANASTLACCWALWAAIAPWPFSSSCPGVAAALDRAPAADCLISETDLLMGGSLIFSEGASAGKNIL